MDHCEDLADELDAHPDGDPGPLSRALAKLRLAFEVHNKFEEELLKPILAARDPHAGIRVERMVDDHVHEHAAIRAKLGSPATSALREVVETLRAHLDAEERYLVTPQVLHEPANPRA